MWYDRLDYFAALMGFSLDNLSSLADFADFASFAYFTIDFANFNFDDFADFNNFADFADFADFAVDHTLGVVLPVGGLAGGVSDVVGQLFLFITRGIPFSRLPGLPGGRSKVLIPFLGSTLEVEVSAA
jgi:hypothetical protein